MQVLQSYLDLLPMLLPLLTVVQIGKFSLMLYFKSMMLPSHLFDFIVLQWRFCLLQNSQLISSRWTQSRLSISTLIDLMYDIYWPSDLPRIDLYWSMLSLLNLSGWYIPWRVDLAFCVGLYVFVLAIMFHWVESVSYTHLTLPTIYSV